MKKKRRSNSRSKRLGLVDIAKAAKVSTATVSRVLHGTPTVDKELRERVEKCIDRMGYRPNIAARSLRMQRTSLIGVIVPNISNPHFSEALRAMQTVSDVNGYTLLVINTDGDDEKTDEAMRSLLSRQVDGVVLIPSSNTTSKTLDDMLKSGTPVVAMDRRIRGESRIDDVTVNVRKGTSEAVRLLANRGRKRIAFIAGPSDIWTASEKRRGYTDGLRSIGMGLDKDLIYQGDYSLESGATQASALLRRRRRPDGLIIANNLMTLGAIRVLLREDVKVPKDIALIGFDDTGWTDVVRPTITVIAQPVRELGRITMELLLRRIAEKGSRKSPENIVLPSELIARESTNGS